MVLKLETEQTQYLDKSEHGNLKTSQFTIKTCAIEINFDVMYEKGISFLNANIKFWIVQRIIF